MADALTRTVPVPIGEFLDAQGSFALYVWPESGDEPLLAWSAGDDAVSGTPEGRSAAIEAGEPRSEVIGRRPLIFGVLLSADLANDPQWADNDFLRALGARSMIWCR